MGKLNQAARNAYVSICFNVWMFPLSPMEHAHVPVCEAVPRSKKNCSTESCSIRCFDMPRQCAAVQPRSKRPSNSLGSCTSCCTRATSTSTSKWRYRTSSPVIHFIHHSSTIHPSVIHPSSIIYNTWPCQTVLWGQSCRVVDEVARCLGENLKGCGAWNWKWSKLFCTIQQAF